MVLDFSRIRLYRCRSLGFVCICIVLRRSGIQGRSWHAGRPRLSRCRRRAPWLTESRGAALLRRRPRPAGQSSRRSRAPLAHVASDRWARRERPAGGPPVLGERSEREDPRKAGMSVCSGPRHESERCVPVRGFLTGINASAFLDARLRALAEQHRVCGAQPAIQRDSETIAIEAGELERRTGRPITRDTAFPTHLPELEELGDRRTLRHLLSHPGGLPGEPGTADASVSLLRRYAADHCHRRNVVLPAGAGFSYSTIGYAVVGRLIEAITGMSWAEAMESAAAGGAMGADREP